MMTTNCDDDNQHAPRKSSFSQPEDQAPCLRALWAPRWCKLTGYKPPEPGVQGVH